MKEKLPKSEVMEIMYDAFFPRAKWELFKSGYTKDYASLYIGIVRLACFCAFFEGRNITPKNQRPSIARDAVINIVYDLVDSYLPYLERGWRYKEYEKKNKNEVTHAIYEAFCCGVSAAQGERGQSDNSDT